MKITDQMSDRAYAVAKAVYRGTKDKASAIEELSTGAGMNPGSATDYVNNLRRMLSGEVYHRTLNFHATSYFLKNIRSDFGVDALGSALSALKKHLDYYDSLGHGRQVKLRKLLEEHLAFMQSDPIHPEEVGSDESLIEGAKKQVTVNAFERNVMARRQCIARYGYRCRVCAFDFEKAYGKIGRKFIHVHHLFELSTIGTEYTINPVRDLRPVCPNCHAMLHKRKPAYTIEELQGYLTKR
ncbi:MAG: HNH endonuclease [Nitrospirales bacterium]